MSYTITSLIVTPKEVPSYYKRLSICLTSNGFSFSRVTVQGTLLTFGQVEMRMDRTLAELATDLKAFCQEQRISPFDFEDMSLVVPSDRSIWVPEEVFSPKHDRDYYEAAYMVPEGFECYDFFNKAVGAYNIFAAKTNVVTAFKIVLPGIDVCSQASSLASSQVLQASTNAPVILMHRRGRTCDFIVCNNGKLLLSNSYEIASDEERLFRALELMKSLDVETPNTLLLLCGDVDKSVFDSMNGYFPHISLYNGKQLRYVNPEFQSLHTYRHVLVLS